MCNSFHPRSLFYILLLLIIHYMEILKLGRWANKWFIYLFMNELIYHMNNTIYQQIQIPAIFQTTHKHTLLTQSNKIDFRIGTLWRKMTSSHCWVLICVSAGAGLSGLSSVLKSIRGACQRLSSAKTQCQLSFTTPKAVASQAPLPWDFTRILQVAISYLHDLFWPQE